MSDTLFGSTNRNQPVEGAGKGSGIGGHSKANRGGSDAWLTPPEIIEALGPFDLDPCCEPVMPWRTAKQMLTNKPLNNEMVYSVPDGCDWSLWDGFVWLNPPYSDIARWMAAMAEHGYGIACVFARTETRWFHEHVWPCASSLLFLRGRPHFHHPDGTRAKGNSGGPIVLVGYGAKARNRLSDAAETGTLEGKLVTL